MSEFANTSPQQRILVTGATGYIGGRLVPELLAKQHSVRVLVRDPRKLERRDWSGVEVVEGDLLDFLTISSAAKDIDAAYYLVHSMVTSGKEFAAADLRAAENFTRACSEHGVKHIVYLGGLGDDSADLSEHLQSRHEVGDCLRQGSAQVTELRSAMVIGAGSASFEIVRDLVRRVPLMICPKWVRSLCQPISIEQLLGYLVGVLDRPAAQGLVLEVGGPDVMTYAEFMQRCAKAMDRRIWMIPVPVLTPRLSSYWLNLVTTVPFSLAQPLVHGLKNDVVCRDSRIKDLIPLREIGFEDSVKLALTEYQKPLRSRWTDADIIKHPNFTEEEPLLVDQREQECLAPASAVYDCVSRIGGDNGYYHAHWLWQLRAGIDWLLGGVGMRRGRPRAKQLFAGDPVDFWRVEEVKPPNTLVLYAEMKLPGQARLRFDVDSLSETRSRLKLSALFLPNGLFGKVYWYSLLPLHAYIFGGMLNRIASEAQTLANQARLQSRSE